MLDTNYSTTSTLHLHLLPPTTLPVVAMRILAVGKENCPSTLDFCLWEYQQEENRYIHQNL
jgi:hypothetical protein